MLEPKFGGATYEPRRDGPRLNRQLDQVRSVMIGASKKLTIDEIVAELANRGIVCSSQSASARLRDLRKSKHGGYDVERRIRPGTRSTWEYWIEFSGASALAASKAS